MAELILKVKFKYRCCSPVSVKTITTLWQ